MSIVVFANRKDYFFTKLCVSSIRYHYPDVEILIVKDKLNGNFSTRSLRKAFQVKVLDLGIDYFGWGAAKVFFLLNKTIESKKYLCLDSDIIFLGKVLDILVQKGGDFIVHPEPIRKPFTSYIKGIYLDEDVIAPYFPDYEYPGFFFNTGQVMATPGLIDEELLSAGFDQHTYPYYKDHKIFPLVDQTVMNIVLPIMAKKGKIKLETVEFMYWSIDFFKKEDNNSFERFQTGEERAVIHYAGDKRTPDLGRMKGDQLLMGFRRHYHKRLKRWEVVLDKVQDFLAEQEMLNKILYYKNRILIELRARWKQFMFQMQPK